VHTRSGPEPPTSVLVGVEGTHASGKTATSLAAAGLLNAAGHSTSWVGDPARSDRFIEDVVLRNRGTFDTRLESSVFCRQILSHLETQRLGGVVVCDKTPMSCVAYASVLLPDTTETATLLIGLRAMVRAIAPLYEVVFLLGDSFTGDDDPIRSKVRGLEERVDIALRAELGSAGVDVARVPTGLGLQERAEWVARECDVRIAEARDGSSTG
jgi:AAA domain